MRIRRGDTVTLRTRYQRVRRTVGKRERGGAVVLATGDSMMQSVDAVLGDRLARRATVASDVRPGGRAGQRGLDRLARRRRASRSRRWHPQATVIFLGTNDLYAIERGDGTRIECCGPEWSDAYEQRAREAMEIYTQGGAGSVVWLTIPVARDERRARADARRQRRPGAAPPQDLPGVRLVPMRGDLHPRRRVPGRHGVPRPPRARARGGRLPPDAGRRRHRRRTSSSPRCGASARSRAAASGRRTRARRPRAARRGSPGGRSEASSRPRWWTVLPISSAAPCSVTTTSTWWRGVVMTVPASNHGTMRDLHRPALGRAGGRQAQQRAAVERQARAGDEVLVAADAGVLRAGDRVGDDLAVDVDRHARR